MLSQTLISILLLALGCRAQTVACGDACPGANGYLIPTNNSISINNFKLVCGTDLNNGNDLTSFTGLSGAQPCAQKCESWNGAQNLPHCTGAVFNPSNQRRILRNGTLTESPSVYADGLILVGSQVE